MRAVSWNFTRAGLGLQSRTVEQVTEAAYASTVLSTIMGGVTGVSSFLHFLHFYSALNAKYMLLKDVA